jgi:hypothetical protein
VDSIRDRIPRARERSTGKIKKFVLRGSKSAITAQ